MLDKLKLFGPIDLETPDFIIQELSEWIFLKIEADELRKLEYRCKVVRALRDNYRTFRPLIRKGLDLGDPEQFQMLLRTINPDPNLDWRPRDLVFALKLMLQMVRENYLGKIGFPTPDNMQQLSPLLTLVNIRKMYPKFRITSTLTIIEVRHFVENITRPNFRYLSMMTLATLSDIAVCQFLAQHRQIWPSDILDCDPQTSGKLNVPISDLQAIEMAIKEWHRDISYSPTPLREYVSLKLTGKSLEPYVNIIEKLNPQAYDLHFTFSPNLPEKYYPKYLTSLAKHHNIERTATIYADLSVLYLTENFHVGVRHGVPLTTTSYMEDIREIQSVQLLTYGSLATKFYIHTIPEIVAQFRTTLSFTNPQGGYFSETAMKRLHRIVQGRIRSKRYNSPDWEDLQEIMETIISLKSSESRQLYQFLEFTSQENYRQEVVEILNSVLNLTLYMRGWRGKEEWPIAIVPTSDGNVTSVMVTQGYIKVDEVLEKYPDSGHIVLKLPLVEYQNGTFHVSTNPQHGLTIGEKLRLVRDGDNGDNIYTCVRISSNWLLASVYRYLSLIQATPPFTPRQIRHIS